VTLHRAQILDGDWHVETEPARSQGQPPSLAVLRVGSVDVDAVRNGMRAWRAAKGLRFQLDGCGRVGAAGDDKASEVLTGMVRCRAYPNSASTFTALPSDAEATSILERWEEDRVVVRKGSDVTGDSWALTMSGMQRLKLCRRLI